MPEVKPAGQLTTKLRQILIDFFSTINRLKLRY